MGRTIAAFVVTASVLAASPALARTEWIVDKTYKTERPTHLDITGFAWPFGVSRYGGAVWLGMPILDSGFIPLNDVLDLEVGAAFISVGDEPSYVAVGALGGVRWGLDLTEEWQIFLTAKAGYRFGLGDDGRNDYLLSFSVGAFWEISKSMYLRVETGNFGVIQGGVVFPL